jgi:hypothetical protein
MADENPEHVTLIVDPPPRPDPRGTWTSCCLRTSRQATVYFGQLSFAFSIAAFCAVMLVRADGDCDRSSAYISLLSFLMGKLLASVTDSTRD